MTLYSSPPSLWEWSYNKPTLLVCWWATTFCTVIIVLRVAGRFIRTERLFREDKMAALALVPMLLRMGCVHFILRYGTNNSDFTGVVMTPGDLRRREIASGLVLASRILYAATLWILKDSVLEFFRRLTGVTWSRTYEKVLMAIRCALVATFAAVVISTLAECRPFSHYWQVLPDPGGQCRQGYVQLITLATCNILTDLMLVLFPVPIILRTHMPLKRKTQLVMLFSLSLAVVAVTIYRVPNTLLRHGRQQYRSLLASIELLFATGAANSLVLGSFVRDRGLKKKKFDFGSVGTAHEGMDPQPRRPTINRHWGSDDNLVRELGLGVHPDLRHLPDDLDLENSMMTPACRPAPQVVAPTGLDSWNFPPSPVAENPHHHRRTQTGDPMDEDQTLKSMPHPSRTDSGASPRKVSFYDAGGLLPPSSGESPQPSASGATLRTDSGLTAVEPSSPPQPPQPPPQSHPHPNPPPLSIPSSPSSVPASPPINTTIWRPSAAATTHASPSTSSWRGSTLRLQDLGGLFLRSPNSSAAATPTANTPTSRSPVASRSRSRPPSALMAFVPPNRPQTIPDPELRDPGGLLR
jgi:hypothetical protein